MKELLPTTFRSNSVNNENWAVESSNKSISSYAKQCLYIHLYDQNHIVHYLQNVSISI